MNEMIKRSGIPTTETVANIGDIYVDTDTNEKYELVDINCIPRNYQFVDIHGCSADEMQYIWEKIGGSSGGGFDLIIISVPNSDINFIAQGDYNTIKKKLDEDQLVTVMVRYGYDENFTSPNNCNDFYVYFPCCRYNNGSYSHPDFPDDALLVWVNQVDTAYYIDANNNIVRHCYD